MKQTISKISVLALSILCLGTTLLSAQDANIPSARGAFFRSMVVPGWGHKYANQGEWNSGAKFHTGTEVVLWAGLINSIRGENQIIQSFESFAASKAGVQLDGRSRSFVLNVANYSSDEAYRDALLRNRAWDALDGASGSEFNWEWESEEARSEFRRLREDADALGRRQTFLMVSLLGNRLISGFNSLRSARSQRKALSARITPIYDGSSSLPSVYLTARVAF